MTDIQSLSFEDALGELERLVRQIEDGRAPLDESVAAYERGVALRRHCETRLAAARERIEAIALAPDGTVAVRPFAQE